MNKVPRCEVDDLLRLIGGRWKTLLLRELAGGSLRHGQLRRRLGGITQKMLTQRLRELQDDGLIQRTSLWVGKIRTVEYVATPWGREVMKVVMRIHRWCIAHREQLKRVRVAETRPSQDGRKG